MKELITKVTKFCCKLLTAIILDICIVLFYFLAYWYFVVIDWEYYRVEAIYKVVAAQTGLRDFILPFKISKSEEINAYNDGTKIVINHGLIKSTNDDELALVIGHEIAHGLLGHLNQEPPFLVHYGMGINDAVSALEANADKMGAFYMMKAGYDICKGREIFHTWRKNDGNSIGYNHPNNSYRYDELNVNCE